VPRQFAVTYDYRCPFARNGHESIVAGLRAGRDWDVRFVPFSLDQVHVEEGETAVWDREPDAWGTGVLALLWSIAVRDAFSDKFLDWHTAAFSARHDEGAKIAKEEVLAEIAKSAGLDPEAIAAEVASGRPLKVLAEEHTEADKRWSVFGVPTFIVGERAAFVRVMDRGNAEDVDKVLDLLEWTDLNEFKHTSVPR
jgi:protein-disulfide isomerase-like protein with CxxC motif